MPEIGKNAILVSLAFPLVFLSLLPGILGLVFDIEWIVLLALLNLSGAMGDVIMMFLIFKLPDDIKYIDYDNNVGCYFVSKEDLSKYKSFGIKYIESGEHNKSLINKDIPRVYISKSSIIILLLFLIASLLFIIVDIK